MYDKPDSGESRSAEPFAEFLGSRSWPRCCPRFPASIESRTWHLCRQRPCLVSPLATTLQTHSDVTISSGRATNKESSRDCEARTITCREDSVGFCNMSSLSARARQSLLLWHLSSRVVPLTTVTSEVRRESPARHLHPLDDTPTTTPIY